MRRPQGYTIVEVMVMAAVALVVLGLLSQVFITALQRTQDGRIRVDMQQEAVFALASWERDLERSSQNGIRIVEGVPLYIGVTGAVGLSGNGSVVWDDNLARWCYDATQRTLSRGLYVRGSGLAYSPTPVDLAGLAPVPGQNQQVFCEDVEEFSLKDRNGSTDLTTQPLVFRLKLRRPLSTSQQFAEFTVDRRYTLRNTF